MNHLCLELLLAHPEPQRAPTVGKGVDWPKTWKASLETGLWVPSLMNKLPENQNKKKGYESPPPWTPFESTLTSRRMEFSVSTQNTTEFVSIFWMRENIATSKSMFELFSYNVYSVASKAWKQCKHTDISTTKVFGCADPGRDVQWATDVRIEISRSKDMRLVISKVFVFD